MSAVANMLNAATREYIPLSGKKLINTFGQNTVLFSKLRKNKRNFEGGSGPEGDIRETIEFRPLPGGARKKGSTYVNVDVSTVQPIYFYIKLLEVTVVVNKVDMKVFNKGKDAIFNMVEKKLTRGMDDLGKYAEIGSYLPGIGASYNANFNGLSEICNDNSNVNSLGLTHDAYGGLSRTNTEYGYAVKGKTYNVNGAITHRQLLKSKKDVTVDNRGPSFGLTTPDCVVYIQDRWQPQQRFTGTTDVDLSLPGWKFDNATIFETRYAPGNWISGASATSGENRIAYEYINRTSTNSGTPLTAYPTITGETFYWLNTDDEFMHLYVSTDPTYNFGFEEWIDNPDNDDLVGRFHLAANITAIDNRRQAELNQIKV
jgi:hypothetical protein